MHSARPCCAGYWQAAYVSQGAGSPHTPMESRPSQLTIPVQMFAHLACNTLSWQIADMQKLVDNLKEKHLQLQKEWRESEGQLSSGTPTHGLTLPCLAELIPAAKLALLCLRSSCVADLQPSFSSWRRRSAT